MLYPQGMVGCNPAPHIDGIAPQHRAEALELVFGYLGPEDCRRQIKEVFAESSLACTACHTGAIDNKMFGGADISVCPEGRRFDGRQECLPHHRINCRSLDGLMGARRAGRLVGAVFSQVAPGKTAAVWLPRLAPGEPLSTAAALYAATWEFLARHQVVLAQVVLPTVDNAEKISLRTGGLDHLADLLYLVSPKSGFPAARPATPFQLEPYGSTRHEQWASVLEATYEDALDCSGLGDVRDSEDIMTGYRSTGEFDPRLWLMVRYQGDAVGCLMLADHPRVANMELLYMGLVPAARGRGWGKGLACHSQWLARLAGRRRLVLAVDAANGPAVQTYAAVGFQAWQHRQLFVKRLSHRPLARIA